VRADQAPDTADTATIETIADITRAVDDAHAAALKRNGAHALEGLLSGGANELKQRVQASVLDLQSGLLERETEVGVVVLGGLRGQQRTGHLCPRSWVSPGCASPSHIPAAAWLCRSQPHPCCRAGASCC
jgi:hypothetical protein